jgi:hypothetical protein
MTSTLSSKAASRLCPFLSFGIALLWCGRRTLVSLGVLTKPVAFAHLSARQKSALPENLSRDSRMDGLWLVTRHFRVQSIQKALGYPRVTVLCLGSIHCHSSPTSISALCSRSRGMLNAECCILIRWGVRKCPRVKGALQCWCF